MSSKHKQPEEFMWILDLQHSTYNEHIMLYSITSDKRKSLENFMIELEKYKGYATEYFLVCLDYIMKYNQDSGVLKCSNKYNTYHVRFSLTKLSVHSGIANITYMFH